MAISCKLRKNYGGDLVNQKYRPLEEIQLDKSGVPDYAALLTNRLEFLRGQGLFPQRLTLITPNWAQLRASLQENTAPPIFVISSNRAGWIKKGLQSIAGEVFTGPTDYTPVQSKPARAQSSPLYAPGRTGGNRSVIVVVNFKEYNLYRESLEPFGVTVIGWWLTGPQSKGYALVGFGASRFAAIEACKQLNLAYAWLMDDNVVAITGFSGYDAVEKALQENPELICAGFEGGTRAELRISIGSTVDKIRGPSTIPPVGSGIIQQAACWNIAQIKKLGINFSPMYVTSAEDLSFLEYLNARKIGYLYYGSMSVLKEQPGFYDSADVNYQNLKDLKRYKEDCIRIITDWESNKDAAPVRLKLLEPGAQEETISDFVNKNFSGLDEAARAIAKCQAVEQITTEAIQAGWLSGHNDTLKNVFTTMATSVVCLPPEPADGAPNGP